ncbi:MAG: peptidoglycan-binding protein [Oscillospiraceae bacterium]|nr:peptidoglycan-binding protein [Oscillospiraceae bacterium]
MPTTPVVPEFITVHLGRPDQPARNVTVPFTDYIKNVASHEIYPTWPEAAIRANILAQLSFTLNRIYTEYYPSRGYDFDITSTTQYDQYFVENGDQFENISRIVDEIFRSYIVRRGNVEPLFAMFCDGVRSQCRGLSQWGTVQLAEQGYTPYQILQYYYGDDIDIVTDAPVSSRTASYPGRPLRRGSVGEDVRTVQRVLNRIGMNFPAIPPIRNTNGIFDLPTEQAVRAFQNAFNIAVDGVVGPVTWYKLKSVWAGVRGLSELSAQGLTLSDVARAYPSQLRYGDSGIGVETIQYYLGFLGFFLPQLPAIGVTGSFDDTTRDAVYAFQRYAGLPVDGIVGNDTWNALQNAYDRLLTDLPDPYRERLAEIYPGRFLVRGDTGENVARLQRALQYMAQVYGDMPTVEADGIFGPATQAAVMAAQRRLGFDVTGAVGPILWRSLIWPRIPF